MEKDKLYIEFGPKLIDALAQVMLDEINILRRKNNLPVKTEQQVVEAIRNKLSNIPDYDWMDKKFT